MSKKNTTHRILNCIPSAESQNDWRISNAVNAGVLRKPAKLPASVDLRETWWKVGDQGSTGSCVGWATADGLLRWHFNKAGLMIDPELPSVRFIWMSSKETDEFTDRPTSFLEEDGTSLKAALDIARKYGCVPEKFLPFNSGTLYQGDIDDFYAKASRYRILNYFNLHNGSPDFPAEWKNWLAAGKGPILARIEVDETFDSANASSANLDVYKPRTVRGGHAVAIVGYLNKRFIIRNSWGTSSWGDKGFAYASEAYLLKAFTESYGVTV